MKNFKKSNLTILIWCLTFALMAQSSRIDSLEQVLTSGKITNEEKCKILINLSHSYINMDTAKSRAYSLEALQLAEKYGLKTSEARAHGSLGNYYSQRKMPYLSHNHYLKAERLFVELEDTDQLYYLYINLMILFFEIKAYDNVEYYANKVITMATEREDWIRVVSAQFHLGVAYYHDNYGEESLEYFLNLHNMAVHINESMKRFHPIEITLASQCAHIYIYNTNRPQEAMSFLYKIRNYMEKNDLKLILMTVYHDLALGHIKMNNIDSAKYYLNKAKESPKTDDAWLSLVYRTSAKLDSIEGNYFDALTNYQKFHDIRDSLSNEEKTIEMARLKVWHEFDQNELEKTLFNQEFQKQRKLTLILEISLILILALLALIVFFYRKIIYKNREIIDKNREMKELNAVKDKLFSVVAHDLRGPIGSLVASLKLEKIDNLNSEDKARLFNNISSQVEDAYGLVDNLLRWAKSQMQGIVISRTYFDSQEESKNVTNALQNVAVEKKITLNNRINKHTIHADYDMFMVIIRNLTTNALKYTSEGGEVNIDSELSNNMLVISVKDTGIGMPQEIQDKLFKLLETKSQRGTQNESGTGLGLVLCADFVKANGGKIWFTSEEGKGSTFFFSVPIKN